MFTKPEELKQVDQEAISAKFDSESEKRVNSEEAEKCSVRVFIAEKKSNCKMFDKDILILVAAWLGLFWLGFSIGRFI